MVLRVERSWAARGMANRSTSVRMVRIKGMLTRSGGGRPAG
jgi:hypothetical protein